MSELRHSSDDGEIPPWGSRIEEKEEDKYGDDAMFSSEEGVWIDEASNQKTNDEAGDDETCQVPGMDHPGGRVISAPHEHCPEGEHGEEGDQDVYWKKPLFHAIIVQCYHYFSNVWLLLARRLLSYGCLSWQVP